MKRIEDLPEEEICIGPQGVLDGGVHYRDDIEYKIFLIDHQKIDSPYQQLEIKLVKEFTEESGLTLRFLQFRILGLLAKKESTYKDLELFSRVITFSSKPYSDVKEAELGYAKLIKLMGECNYIIKE